MRSKLLMAIAVIVVASLACSLGGGTTEAPTEVEEGGATEAPPGGAEQPEVEEEPTEAALPEVDPDALSGLDSYRVRFVATWTAEDGTTERMEMEQEHTRSPAAQRMYLESEEGETFEFVQIGDTAWFCSAGSCAQTQQSEEELAGSFGEEMAFDPADFSEDTEFEYVGQETVNGVRARHYVLELSALEAAALAQGEVTDVQAESWISDESGLPTFVVRHTMSWKETRDEQEGATEFLYEVYDINASITIEPPEGAAGWPEDVPEYANATDLIAMEGFIAFSTADDVATVADFYRSELPTNGWTSESDDDLSGMIMQSWTKGGQTLSLMISADEEGTGVVISIE